MRSVEKKKAKGFSKEWDSCYRKNTHMSVWPWSDLVSYVMRYGRPKKHQDSFKVLELGCGAGANIPFFKWLGADYYAIEGSPSIVVALHKKFPEFKKRIITGDFTKEIAFEPGFDLVVDRSSLTHNLTEPIERSLSIIYDKMKPGGKYIGIDWFSTKHSDFEKGRIAEDEFTRNGFPEGQFAGVGSVHFSDRQHITDLFKDFSIEILEHKIIKTEIPEFPEHLFAAWNFSARKD